MIEGYQFSNQAFFEVLYKEEGSLIFCCCQASIFCQANILSGKYFFKFL